MEKGKAMSRYIDADAMKEWIDEYVSVFKKSDNKDIKGYIEHQPTIEAVPKDFHDKTCEAMAKAHQEEIANMVSVVRCKECRYCKRKRGTFKGEPIIFYRCEENNRDVESDDFCSYGERENE